MAIPKRYALLANSIIAYIVELQSTTVLANGVKMKFSIKDFFSKRDQIHRKLRIWSHVLNKSFVENFNFYAVSTT